MSDEHSQRPARDGDETALLLAEAGARPPLPDEELARLREAARSAWAETVAARAGDVESAAAPAGDPATDRDRAPARGTDLGPPPLSYGSAAAPSSRAAPAPDGRFSGAGRPATGRRVVRWAAALLVLGLGLAAWWWRGPGSAPAQTVARVLAAGAPVEVLTVEAGGGSRADVTPATGTALPQGAEVVTGPADGGATGGWITLSLDGGGEVRVAPGSRLRLASARHLELAHGAVYVDSGGAGGPLRIATPVAEVRDVGTRFAVRLVQAPRRRTDPGGSPSPTPPDTAGPPSLHAGSSSTPAAGPSGLRVRVRDGDVRIDLGEREVRVAGGEEVEVGAGGAVERRPSDPYGRGWEWVLDAAPPFALEGRRLDALLDHVAAETGWRIVFADPALEATARRIELHGDTGSLPPHRALFVVLPGAGLEGEVEDGVLTLRWAGAPPATAPR